MYKINNNTTKLGEVFTELKDDKIVQGDFFTNETKVIKIINLMNYKEEGKLTGHTYDIISLLFLKNNKLVSDSLDNTIKIWNLDSFKEEKTLYIHFV